jgi:hypothetical protein
MWPVRLWQWTQINGACDRALRGQGYASWFSCGNNEFKVSAGVGVGVARIRFNEAPVKADSEPLALAVRTTEPSDPEPDQLVQKGLTRTLELSATFLQNYEDRATVIADKFVVDKVSRVHSSDDDGDLAFVGRTPVVKLITRAEIMNGAMHRNLVAILNRAAETHSSLTVSGAWRIWFERTDNFQLQGGAEASPESSNPSHFFELHPVLSVDDNDLSNTFVPVDGFEPHSAERAFSHYEKLRCTVVTDEKTGRRRITVSEPSGYNYVAFAMKVAQAPVRLSDGHAVIVSVESNNGTTLVPALRIVTVKGTRPDETISSLAVGNHLRLMGIPRLSLKTIRAAQDGDMKLPYEMIAAAELPRLRTFH